MNSTAVNISAQISVSVPVFNSLVYIQSGIAGSYGNSLSDFLRNCWGFVLFCHTVFSQWLHHFTFPPAIHRGLYFPTSLPKLSFSCFFFFFFFNYSYPNECKVVSHCGFDLYLPGFHGDAVVKNWPAVQETVEMWVQSLGRDDPLK